MTLKELLFPPQSRSFPGERWFNISLRTLHLIGLAGLGGGFLYSSANELWRVYLYLTLLSGLGLTLIALWSSVIWLVQLRGQVVLLKLLLLALIPLWPAMGLPLFIGVIVISGLIAHAPGDVRYYSLFHGRRIEQLPGYPPVRGWR